MIDDLRILKCFVAVAEELNFRKAAERLHMSQPPLSRLIASLEQSLGVILFHRNTKTVTLTREGHLLLEEAYVVIDTVASAGRRLRHQFHSSGSALKLATSSVAYFVGLTELTGRFRKDHPSIPLEIEGMDNQEQIQALLSGSIDIGFSTSSIRHPEIECQLFARSSMRLAIPASHPHARSTDALQLQDLRNEIFILHDRRINPTMYDEILRHCEEAGFKPRVRLKRDSDPCMGLVSSGQGVHFTAATPIGGHCDGIVFLEFPGQAPVLNVHAIWRKNDPSPDLRKLLDLMDSPMKKC